MARILCNVAGGGKPLKGNAEAGDVLAGKTFSNKQSNALTGSMPNNGAWSASTSGSGSVTIPAGYHNGSGTVSGSASYNSGYTNGYNQGVTDKRNDLTWNKQYVDLKNPADSTQCQWDVQGKAGYSGVIFQLAGATYWVYHGDDDWTNSSGFPVSYNSSTGVVHIGPFYRHTAVQGYIYYY